MREEPIITEQYSAPKGLTVKAYLTGEEEEIARRMVAH
jgi:hypothetical protein